MKLKYPICLYGLLFLFFSNAPLQAQPSAQSPNFVIIIGDDISWDDLGCYGNPVVKSPNIDQLASEGLKFTNTYLTASSCSPSRCSIVAGRYPHNTGAAELHTPLPAGMPTMPGELKRAGYYTAAAGKWHMGPDAKSDFDLVVEQNNGSGGEAQWLNVLQQRPRDKPFFMWLASHDAHRIWQADDFGVPHDPGKVFVPPYLVDAPATRQDLASYYNEIQRFDFYVGQVKNELLMQGVLDNTIMVVMADNGRPFPRCKTRVYDSGMKTPFVLSWPKGVQSRGAESTSMISVIDIAPTFLEMAGIKAGDTFQGVSFLPTIKKPDAPHRNFIFAEHNWHDYEAHERMVRSKHFMFVSNKRPQYPNQGPADSNESGSYADLKTVRDLGKLNQAQSDVFATPRAAEELFDCLLDPQQLNNVASQKVYAGVLQDMRNVLHKWTVETGDDVPDQLTPSWYDTETGKNLDVKQVRGEMPGTKTKAVDHNSKGPF
ncbi:MAG: sulfatase [Cyclobacteriaceae bacterium]|nr:sulfatase [Cyclobacteriaceae bacterium]